MPVVPDKNSNASSNVVVYFVDDDRGMVSATSQWLTLSGIRVRAFADPTALVKVLKVSQPCVVVSDIRMPGLDGIELMKLVHAKDKHIPVILITGHGDIPLAVEAMKLGAYEFLQKPFSPEKLLKVIEQASRELEPDPERSENPHSSDVAVEISPRETDTPIHDLSDQVDVFEKDVIERSLARNRGSMIKVMGELNIPRRTLNAKMKKYGLQRSQFR